MARRKDNGHSLTSGVDAPDVDLEARARQEQLERRAMPGKVKIKHAFKVVATAQEAGAVLADCTAAVEALPGDAGKEAKRLVRWDATKAQRQVWALNPAVTALIDTLVSTFQAGILTACAEAAEAAKAAHIAATATAEALAVAMAAAANDPEDDALGKAFASASEADQTAQEADTGGIPGFTAGRKESYWYSFGLPSGYTVTNAEGKEVTGEDRERTIEAQREPAIITGMVSRLLLGRKATG